MFHKLSAITSRQSLAKKQNINYIYCRHLVHVAQAVLSYGGALGKDECQGPPTSFQELQNKKKVQHSSFISSEDMDFYR